MRTCLSFFSTLRALLLIVAFGLGTASAGARVLDRALAVGADTPRFPEAAVAAAEVALPDDWSVSRPRESGPVWYRLSFDRPDAGGALQALFIQRACANLEVHLNGQLLHRAGQPGEALAHHCQQPQLVPLPGALLRSTGNQLDIKLAGFSLQQVAARQRAGWLPALEIGDLGDLSRRHARALALQVTLPQVASGLLLLLGCSLLVLSRLTRRDGHLVYFGALAIGWAVLTARLWWQELPIGAFPAELLLVSTVPLVAWAAVMFLLRHAGWHSRPIAFSMGVQCVVVPISLLLAGPERLHATASTWYAVLALEVVGAVGIFLRTSWRVRREPWWPMALMLIGAVALLGVEIATQRQDIDAGWATLSHLAMPLLLIAMGLRLMRQYGRALQLAEQGRDTLEARIREATAEAEKNFAQLAELRVEQVTERERKRIAADLHDDLGAKLLTIVHTSDSERISSLAREALEEMRLSVRGLTGKPVKLIDALGDWRAEVVSRLGQAGIEAEWQTPGDELPQTLSARAYVQTTRILREAVNNIIKHSGASRCALEVAISDGDFRILIQDNGRGIPLELDGRLDRGHGMSSMKHRAKQLQGQCLVESGPGYGTVIRLTLPLDRQVESV